jgi:stage V sporulation protein AB
MFRLLVLAFSGISFGLLTAAGVFTVLTAVGLIPRFVGETHSAKELWLYEDMVIWGTILGGLFSVFAHRINVGPWLAVYLTETGAQIIMYTILLLVGSFGGMFVGCLALSIAEMLDSIPIFTRRVAFRHGLGIVILCMAAAKVLGSLFYFYNIYSG